MTSSMLEPPGPGGSVSQRVESLLHQEGFVFNLVFEPPDAPLPPDACNFLVGDPQDEPLPELVNALREAALPKAAAWFAYMGSDEAAQHLVAEGLEARFGIPFGAGGVCMTCGSFGGLAMSLQAVVDQGDEVVVNQPAWPFYGLLIRAAGGTPVDVGVRADWDLDLDAIEAAITPRTRAIVVNTPNNPTGRVYPAETLQRLASLLARTARRNGRPLYLVSDESYNKIVYEPNRFVTPASFYPQTILVHTYGKTLLAPGLRIGYVALPPSMPNRSAVRRALTMVQLASGWAFPTSLLQRAIHAFESLSIDMQVMQRRRDRMVKELQAIGYRVHEPEGTFYLLPEAPNGDAQAFVAVLASHGVFAIPCWGPWSGHFRLSLTATDDMVDRSIEAFRRAFTEASSSTL